MQNEELKNAQVKLQTSQNRYFELYNFAPTGYFTLDEKELVKDVNLAGTALLGVKKKNLINNAFIRFVANDSRNNFYKRIKIVRDTGAKQKFELNLLKGKKPVPVILEINSGPYKGGGFKSLLITAVDITKRKRMENEKEELLEDSQRDKDDLSILIENIIDEVWFCNKQGDIILANAAARKFEQDAKPEDEKSLNGLIKSVEVFDSDGITRPREGSPLLRSLNGEILTDLEEIIIFPGSDEKRYRQVSSAPIKNKDGEITGAVAVVRDITRLKQDENKIIQAKEEWERTFDAVPDLIAIIDNNYQIIRTNKAMANKLGVNPDDTIGLTCYQAVHGMNNPLNTCPHTKLIKDGCEHSAEIHEDKLKGDYLVSVSPLVDSDGKLMGGVHVARDITERKQYERKITESENRYRMIGQLISDFAYSCVHGEAGSYEVDWITDSFYHLTGFTEKELNLNRCWLFTVHPEDEQIAHHQLAVLKAGSKNVCEFRIISNNGEIRWLRNHVECVEDTELGKLRIYGAAEDITNLKRVVKDLEQSEERFRTLIYNSADIIRILDENGHIIFDSQSSARILGYPEGSLIGKSPLEFVHPDDLERVKHDLDEAYDNKSPGIPTEFRIRKADGEYLPVETVSQNMTNFPGIGGIVVTTHPIKERKEMEDEIKASLKEKEVLLKEIHHRVKNNMQIISSLLSLQTRYVEGDDLALDALKDSQNRVKSMAMIHEKLYQSNNLTDIDFDDYIIRLVSDLFYSYQINEGQIKPIIEVEEVKLNMETAIPCGLIISELVSNSLKHAFPEGRQGKVCLSLKKHDNNYELKISDNGIGFPDEFDLKNTDSLGLILVNSLINQLDGNFTLNRSHGTEFKITFKELEYKERI